MIYMQNFSEFGHRWKSIILRCQHTKWNVSFTLNSCK